MKVLDKLATTGESKDIFKVWEEERAQEESLPEQERVGEVFKEFELDTMQGREYEKYQLIASRKHSSREKMLVFATRMDYEKWRAERHQRTKGKSKETKRLIFFVYLLCLTIGSYFWLTWFKEDKTGRESWPKELASGQVTADNQDSPKIEAAFAAPAESIASVDRLEDEPPFTGPAQPVVTVNHTLDDLAAYMAGISDHEFSTIDDSLLQPAVWGQHCAAMSASWQRYERNYAAPMRQWRNTQLQGTDDNKTVFYPFSGPDILSPRIFFPRAEKFLMIGLEPVGSLPSFNGNGRTEAAATYCDCIKKSLQDVFRLGFFRTHSLARDLHGEELNGAIHLILFFLKRTRHSLVDIKPISIDDDGQLILYSSFEELNEDSLTNTGAEISVVDSDSVLKKVYYFSIDLSDKILAKNHGFVRFLENHGTFNSYIKSASYLMHKPEFSIVRNTILDQSQYVLQDDSGIPLERFSTDKGWEITHYGSYIKPIPLFSSHYQADLRKEYTDKSKVKELPFGIGYKYRKGDANLMLAQRRVNEAKEQSGGTLAQSLPSSQ